MENITYNDEYFRNSDFVDEITSIASSSPASSIVTLPHGDGHGDGYGDSSHSSMLSKDVIQLLHMKELRIQDILQLKAKEDDCIVQINELKKQYGELQGIYQQAEYAMQMLVAQEMSEE